MKFLALLGTMIGTLVLSTYTAMAFYTSAKDVLDHLKVEPTQIRLNVLEKLEFGIQFGRPQNLGIDWKYVCVMYVIDEVDKYPVLSGVCDTLFTDWNKPLPIK